MFAKEMYKLRVAQKELQDSQKKTDEQLRKTDEQLREQLKKVSQKVGGIGWDLGKAEGSLTASSVPKVFKKLGIKVEAVYSRVKALQNGQVKDEIDILCTVKKNGVIFSLSW